MPALIWIPTCKCHWPGVIRGLRSTIFGHDWCWLVPADFNALLSTRLQFDALCIYL